jgi:hypothetical protein
LLVSVAVGVHSAVAVIAQFHQAVEAVAVQADTEHELAGQGSKAMPVAQPQQISLTVQAVAAVAQVRLVATVQAQLVEQVAQVSK